MKNNLILSIILLPPSLIGANPFGELNQSFLKANVIIAARVLAIDPAPIDVRSATWSGALAPDWRNVCRVRVRVDRKVDGPGMWPEGSVATILWPSPRPCTDTFLVSKVYLLPLTWDAATGWHLSGTSMPSARGPLTGIAPIANISLNRLERVAYYLLYPWPTLPPAEYERYLDEPEPSRSWSEVGSTGFLRVLTLILRTNEAYRPAVSRYLSRWPYGICTACGRSTGTPDRLPPSDAAVQRILDFISKAPKLEVGHLDELRVMSCSDRPEIAKRAKGLLAAKGYSSLKVDCFHCRAEVR